MPTHARYGTRATATHRAYIRTACDDLGVHFAVEPHPVWTPALTSWPFLSQCARESKSCAAAVARVLVLRIGLGSRPCSQTTGADGEARAKRPTALLSRLAVQLGDELDGQANPDWQRTGRRVVLVDRPDTPAHQAEYPQHTHQKRGMGFPMIRRVVRMGFATGC